MKKNKDLYGSPNKWKDPSAKKQAPLFIEHYETPYPTYVPPNHPTSIPNRMNDKKNANYKPKPHPSQGNSNGDWTIKRDGNFLLKARLSKKTGFLVKKKLEDWRLHEVPFYETLLEVRTSGGEVREITATLETKDRRGKTVNVPLSGDKLWLIRLDEIPGKMIRIHVKCKFRLSTFKSKPLEANVSLFAN